jgi:hypothetical protein
MWSTLKELIPNLYKYAMQLNKRTLAILVSVLPVIVWFGATFWFRSNTTHKMTGDIYTNQVLILKKVNTLQNSVNNLDVRIKVLEKNTEQLSGLKGDIIQSVGDQFKYVIKYGDKNRDMMIDHINDWVNIVNQLESDRHYKTDTLTIQSQNSKQEEYHINVHEVEDNNLKITP